MPRLIGPSSFTAVVVSNSAGGDITLVAAVANKRVFLFRAFLVAAAATSLTWKSDSVALSGAFPLAAGGGFILDLQFGALPDPWYQIAKGAALNLNSSAASLIAGTVWIRQE